ncbi:MAG: (deoxy)nucleoside triphosphate pyrophosphohydrolase [Polyangiaceae bacterium]
MLITVVAAAILEGDTCLVTRRGPGGAAAFKWEFPGGKVRPGESGPHALEREIAEELALVIEVGSILGRARAEDAATIDLTLYEARIRSGSPQLREHLELRWARAHDLDGLDFAAPDVPLIEKVVARLSQPG